MTSQNKLILRHLQNGHSITPLEALKLFGCLRLGARIYDLKQAGYNIQKEIIYNGRKRYAKYFLLKTLNKQKQI